MFLSEGNLVSHKTTRTKENHYTMIHNVWVAYIVTLFPRFFSAMQETWSTITDIFTFHVFIACQNLSHYLKFSHTIRYSNFGNRLLLVEPILNVLTYHLLSINHLSTYFLTNKISRSYSKSIKSMKNILHQWYKLYLNTNSKCCSIIEPFVFVFLKRCLQHIFLKPYYLQLVISVEILCLFESSVKKKKTY